MNDTPNTPASSPADRPGEEVPWGFPTRTAWLGSAPPGIMRYAFPGHPQHVREVRALVGKLFTGTGREEDAELIADELANNALLYTRSGWEGGWFGVQVAFDGGLARIAVTDLGGAGWIIGGSPASRTPADRAQASWLAALEDDLADVGIPELDGIALGGRGLPMITGLAVTTGAEGSHALGHTVWATLALPGTRHADHAAIEEAEALIA